MNQYYILFSKLVINTVFEILDNKETESKFD